MKAAIATVCGQIVAALVVFRKGFRKSPAKEVYPGHIAEIFRLGLPNILMQSAYTFYILGLNLVLAGISDYGNYNREHWIFLLSQIYGKRLC